MIDKEYIKEFVGDRIYYRGKNVYDEGLVYDLTVENESDYDEVVRAVVESSNYNDAYFVNLEIYNNHIIDYRCDCPFSNSFSGPCKHIGATLFKYIDYKDRLKKFSRKQTDYKVKSLFRSLEDDGSLLKDKNILDIELHNGGDGALNVEFKVGKENGKHYVIKNISDFINNIKVHNVVKYGKELEFEHSLSAFDVRYHKLINFLVDVLEGNNAITNGSLYYNSSAFFYRSLTLRGRFLDEFFDVIKGLPIYYFEIRDMYSGRLEKYSLIEDKYDLNIVVEKEDEGINIQMNDVTYFLGSKYIYWFDKANKEIAKSLKFEKEEELLEILYKNRFMGTYIDKDDLPYFSEYLYPLLCLLGKVKLIDIDPEDYKIEKANYSFYLDLIDKNILTCKIKATYPSKEYELSNDDLNLTYEDKKIINKISNFFPYYDNYFYKDEDDDELYEFLKSGVETLNNIGEVFISDKLKRINIKTNSKVSVGLSLSNDLLKLDLISDNLSNDEIAEILAKYDIKKKYYRLKSGQFIELNDNLVDLKEIKDKLNLTSKEIENGEISLPKYRAFYLDSLSEEVSNKIAKDKNFNDLILSLKNTDTNKYKVPEVFKDILRPYQVDGFKWLSLLKDNGFGALLADEMGLGKTIQVIALLKSIKDRNRCLVVCPASLVYNWSNEINKFDKSISCKIVAGLSEKREELIKYSNKDDVLITSYDLLKRDIDYYKDIRFSIEIVDEAQYIKNINTLASKAVKAIDADYKIALTGTPIENKLSEIYSIFEYMMPGFFRSYKYFKETYESPIIKDEDKDSEEDLNKLISPFILRRLKKDVLKDLPDKLEEVYYAPLEGEQKRLYEARALKLKQTLAKTSEEEFKESKLMVLSEITRLRQICCDPHIIYDNYKDNSAKKDLCIDLINNAISGGHKVLLFSQFTSVFDELKPLFKENNIKYYLLDGSTPKHKRANMVESFQNDDVPVFCISLKAGGTGLNLTVADIVIHYDPWWNVAVENQASDRAHRIGQKNVVSVYRLIMKDTIEERIIDLQNSKLDLANRVLSGDKISSATLSKDDLLKLL